MRRWSAAHDCVTDARVSGVGLALVQVRRDQHDAQPEIASEPSVSLNTVSTHVRSIYAKLQVRDRSSAVRRARELRLLTADRTR